MQNGIPSEQTVSDASVSAKEILKIGIPSVFEVLFTTLASIIDSKMVSSMGIAAISAVSVTNQPRLFVLAVFFAINTAVSSLTARYVGKKDRDAVNRILLTALLCVLVLGIVLSFLCVVFAEPIMKVCSNQPDTMADSVVYFRIVMGGLLFNILFLTVNASLRGYGMTMMTMVSNIVSCGVNITLNYALIQGHWGFPALGIEGAAIATVAGTFVAMIVCFAYALRSSCYISLSYCIRSRIRITSGCFSEIAGMWKKIVTENIFTRVGFLFSGMIAARAGSFDMSVYSIGMHLLNITFAVGSGLQSAAVALVGRSFGAGRTDRIKSYSRKIVRIGILISAVVSAVFILFGRQYYSFFGTDPKFVHYGIISCIIIGAISPVQTCQLIYNGILQGVGDVRFTMIAAIISVTVVNTIVCLIGTVILGYGVWGIWASVCVSQIVRMAMLHIRCGKIIERR